MVGQPQGVSTFFVCETGGDRMMQLAYFVGRGSGPLPCHGPLGPVLVSIRCQGDAEQARSCGGIRREVLGAKRYFLREFRGLRRL